MIQKVNCRILPYIITIVLVVLSLYGYTQHSNDNTDSIYSARLMQDNLGLYNRVDSLNKVLEAITISNKIQNRQIDSLQKDIANKRAQMAIASKRSDTLETQMLQARQEFLSLKQQMLAVSSELEHKLQLLRDQEYQLNDCRILLREAQMAASLNEAKLIGKNEVNTSKIEAREREIAYLQESLKEKDRIITEKTNELNGYYKDKSTSLRMVDSLSRAVNAKELELVRLGERLRILEGQYNELVAQKEAAQNKKKKVRFVQGVGLKNYRTPDYQLAPQSSATTATYVITNKNTGNFEFDYITGVSLSIYDLSKPEGKYTYDAGLFLGFGGTNLFKNFYISPSFKAFDFFHFLIGVNVAEYQQLQSGFNEGDVLPPGMSIPTVKEWKANLYFGMTIDFELLSNIPKKI